MERTKLAAVMPADMGWSDIGSWSSVWDVLDHDVAGNATEGPVVVMETRNSLVHSEEPMLTTVVGLDDVIVVATAPNNYPTLSDNWWGRVMPIWNLSSDRVSPSCLGRTVSLVRERLLPLSVEHRHVASSRPCERR